MSRIIKHFYGYLLFTSLLLFGFLVFPVGTDAKATDEIKDFTITVDVNADASLKMVYHIDWKVLDDSIGKLEWIDLGLPNRYHEDITPITDTIDHINDKGNKAAIYLDRSYGEGETVSLEFSMTQDHMYQIDKWTEGETVYTFTPAWFDGMDVRQLTIRWNMENASAWQPDCLQEDGYLVFRSSLPAGEQYTMSVTYPNDAFGFSSDRQAGSGDDGNYSGNENVGFMDIIYELIGIGIFIAILVSPFVFIFRFLSWIISGIGFGSDQEMKKKITRTKIEYFENCPSCGAAREEGKDSCPYCGRSMIKKKEVIEESQIEDPEKYSKKGTYRYGDSGNTYIRVNVINVPVHRPRSSSHSSGRSSHRSSCACVSSCACACACASSGRAGCSAKEFFKDSIHKGRIRIHSGEDNILPNTAK